MTMRDAFIRAWTSQVVSVSGAGLAGECKIRPFQQLTQDLARDRFLGHDNNVEMRRQSN